MPNSADLPQDALIHQRISGGILPVAREWIIYSDGRVRHPNGQITQLDKSTLEFLVSRGQSVLSDNAETSYPAPPGSADYRTLELTVRTSNGVRSCVVEDSNAEVPAELLDYFRQIQETVKKSAARESTK